MSCQNELLSLRKIIDETDRQMAHLFQLRMDAAKKIGILKSSFSKKIYDPVREEELIQRSAAYIDDENILPYYEEFLKKCMELSKQIQLQTGGALLNNKAQWPAGALLAPVPVVLVSCGSMDAPNVITIAWTGILASDPPKTYISVRPSRLSHEIISNSKNFVINLTTKQLAQATDFCGVRSGRDTDKIKLMGLDIEKASMIDCPAISQSPVNIECRVTDIIPLGSHDVFVADILCVNVNKQYIDEDGKFHMDQCGLIAYSHGEYFELGKKLGSFGYTVRKKP